MIKTNRVLHLTLEKCGSQWVRDVLSAPEILPYSKLPHSGVSLNTGSITNLIIPDQTFSGPIYGMNRWEWNDWKKPGDRALVVLRDPRDVMISLMYSWLYSHDSNVQVDIARRTFHGVKSHEEQIKLMITSVGDNSKQKMYRYWANYEGDDALLVSYEQLIQDEQIAFRKIVDWLGWEVPEQILFTVVNRLSFKSRSGGRQPGEVDNLSHFRRGVANDWKNHFTRDSGCLWEEFYPGLLCEIGYEQSDDWWRSLPKVLVGFDEGDNEKDLKNLLIDSLEQKLKNQQSKLVAKEKVIQNLIEICAERLAVINSLNNNLSKTKLLTAMLMRVKSWVQ